MLHDALYPLTMYGDSTFHSDICFPYDLAVEWTVLCLLDECVSFGNIAAQIIYPCCVCSLAVNAFYSPDFDHGYICQYVLLLCKVFSFSWQSQCISLRVSKSLKFSTLCCLCCHCHFWELMPHTGLWYLTPLLSPRIIELQRLHVLFFVKIILRIMGSLPFLYKILTCKFL